MTKKHKTLFFIPLILIIALTIINNPFKRDIWDVNAYKLRYAFRVISDNAVIDDLAQFTPFQWDTLYSFSPYTPDDEIYKVVGYKWDNITETVNEGMNQVVFVKDGKVVCYIYGYPEKTKLSFNFNKYRGSYVKLTSDQPLPFEVNISPSGITYLTLINKHD